MLPAEMACGSGMTCWRRLRDWHAAGVWQRLHHVLLERLNVADQLDWSRASLDAQSIPAAKGGRTPARTQPTAASRAPNATCW
jgi:transposase